MSSDLAAKMSDVKDYGLCAECGRRFELSAMLTMSPDPDASLVCHDCAGGIATKMALARIHQRDPSAEIARLRADATGLATMVIEFCERVDRAFKGTFGEDQTKFTNSPMYVKAKAITAALADTADKQL